MANKRVRRHPLAFQKMAVERTKNCPNMEALARELGVHCRLLYKWRERLEPLDNGESPPANSVETQLRQELAHCKRLLADKTLEVDFFRGALQKIEARRQHNGKAGETASTTKSGS